MRIALRPSRNEIHKIIKLWQELYKCNPELRELPRSSAMAKKQIIELEDEIKARSIY